MKTASRPSRSPAPGYRAALLAALLAPTVLPASAQDAAPAKPADDAAKAAEDAPAEAEAPLRNWIEFGAGGTIVDGNQAAYHSRFGLPSGAFGGIESFHYEEDLPKDGRFTLDGRGIYDNQDYGIRLELAYPEKGYVRLGYEEFRTWYDGSGGYYPATGAWYDLYDDALALDRSELTFEAGLRLPTWPELTFRYTRQTREGEKDATTWGETTATGGAGPRSLVPAFWDIDEVRNIFAIDGRHTLGNTTLGLGVRYEVADQENRRNMRRNPGEPADRHVTQREDQDTDLFNIHASSASWLRSNVLLTAGYAYTDLESDLGGYRVFGTAYDPDLAQRLPNPDTYESLTGGSQLQQHVVNLNLLYLPWESLALIPSARLEKQDVDSSSRYGQPAAPLSPNLYEAASERGLLDVSEALELRYTGVTNWVFFARGTWLQGEGDLDEDWNNLSTGGNVIRRSTDDERTSQKYAAGVQWYPARRLNLGAGYYYKQRDNDYTHPVDSTPNGPGSLFRYPAYLLAQEVETHDANAKITWRPRANLTLVGRYDFQVSDMHSRADQLAQVQTAEVTSQIVGGSVSWVPAARLYLQGNVNFVMDETDTPVSDITAAVPDAENDYWNASVTAGFAVDDRTDLSASYFYYRADNFADISAAGMPYGVGAEEHGVTAAFSRQLTRTLRWTLRYGFFTSDDETAGGYNDYDAHLVYSTLQLRF